MSTDDVTVIKPRPGKRGALKKPDSADQTIIKPRPKPKARRSLQDDATVIKSRRLTPAGGTLVHSNAQLAIPEKTERPARTLVQAAQPILALAPQLRQIQGKIDTDRLQSQIKTLIENFNLATTKLENDPEIRKNSHYVLCALIDETILNTPWGESSGWSQTPILSTFHGETYGGEKFYRIIDDCLANPYENNQLIEILFIALSLGFMGKFRIDPQGPVKIEKLRGRLYEVLTRSSENTSRALSVNVDAQQKPKQRLQSFIPVWTILGILALIAFGLYAYLLIGLNKSSDATRLRLAALIPNPGKHTLDSSMVRPEFIELRALLTPEINLGVLSVEDYATHTSITLHNNELFSSGSNQITPSFEPILDKIGKALESIPGRIVVSGHTDNESIRTTRYPSNWHLSLARASEIVKYLATNAELTSRLLPEGRGANEPIASNDTPAGRAKNRRVVLDVYYLRPSPQTYNKNQLSLEQQTQSTMQDADK